MYNRDSHLLLLTFNRQRTYDRRSSQCRAANGLKRKYDRGTGSVVAIANYDGAIAAHEVFEHAGQRGGCGSVEVPRYYLDATTFERGEYVYDASNVLVAVIAPESSTWEESTYPPAADALRRPESRRV